MIYMPIKLILTSDDCELLLAFENYSSLVKLSQHMQRDNSVISRSLKSISEAYPVAKKKADKLILTEIGRTINDQTRSAVSIY